MKKKEKEKKHKKEKKRTIWKDSFIDLFFNCFNDFSCLFIFVYCIIFGLHRERVLGYKIIFFSCHNYCFFFCYKIIFFWLS